MNRQINNQVQHFIEGSIVFDYVVSNQGKSSRCEIQLLECGEDAELLIRRIKAINLPGTKCTIVICGDVSDKRVIATMIDTIEVLEGSCLVDTTNPLVLKISF